MRAKSSQKRLNLSVIAEALAAQLPCQAYLVSTTSAAPGYTSERRNESKVTELDL